MIQLGLIGDPISHSKSPALFQAAYKTGGSYELIETADPDEAMNRFLYGGYRGINVTAPFKDTVMKYVTHPDPVSSLLGSANVLVKGEGFANGKGDLYSYNTDYYGVRDTLRECLKERHRLPGCIREAGIRNAVVIGAGGAGKAAAFALRESFGWNVFLANRSAGRTADFAASVGAEYISLDQLEACVLQSDLVVYALSFPLDRMQGLDLSGKIVFEANYAKPVLAPENGIKTGLYISGKYWLLYQAVFAFGRFMGSDPNVMAMRRVMDME